MGLEDFLIRKAYRLEKIPVIHYVPPMMEPQKTFMNTLVTSPYLENGRTLEARSIAIIRDGGIGDLIMLSSAIRAMKILKPDLRIKLVTGPSSYQVFRGSPYIDEMAEQKTYDPKDDHLVINLVLQVEPHEMGGGLEFKTYASENRTDIFHKLLHVEHVERKPTVMIDEAEKGKWQKRLATLKPIAVIHSTCTARARTISPETVTALAWKLASQFTVLIVGNTELWQPDSWINLKELRGEGIINLMDRTTISELIAILSLSDLVIAPDSGVLHIAGALGIKAIGIFGNIVPITRCKYYPSVKAIFPEGALDCIPCHDLWHCDLKGIVGAPCMRIFSADDIYRTAMEWFDGKMV